MKRFLTPVSVLIVLAASHAQTPRPPSDDPAAGRPSSTESQEWHELLAVRKEADDFSRDVAPEDARGKGARDQVRTRSKAVADRARQFYQRNPGSQQAAEARKLEVVSLIQAQEEGEAGETKRLELAVAALRTDPNVAAGIRAQGVAAYEFSRALRGISRLEDRKAKTESVARGLMREFPAEPPAYEALLAVARASRAEKTTAIAREVLTSAAPAEYKKAAQALIDREGLIGQPLQVALGDEFALASKLATGQPLIVYTWASWAPGSVELGRMIQARRFAALAICLDESTDEARVLAHQAGLGGEQTYDPQGRDGSLARRLAFTTAGQIYLVDAQGIVRDVRGGEDLETKLTALGFSTPPLAAPSLAELLRR